MSEAKFDVANDGSFSWAWRGPLLVTYAEPGIVPPHRFDAWIECIEQHDFDHVFGGSGGSASITGPQRRTVVETLGSKQHICVLVDDRVTRGVFTALSWLGLQVRCYAWVDIVRATTQLGTPNMTSEEVIEIMLELRSHAESAAASAIAR